MKEEILEKVCNGYKNLVVEGGIASGKTTNVLFPVVESIIDNRESLLILDSKEEYLNKYYDKLKENNYNIVILNLRDMDKSEGWNPLEYPYHLYKDGKCDEAQEYIEKIVKTMFYDDTKQDPFWTLSAEDVLTGMTLGLFENGKDGEINLSSVSNMLSSFDKKWGLSDYTTEYFKAMDIASKPYLYASAAVNAPRETKNSILSEARQKLRLYVSRNDLTNFMNKTTFDFTDIANNPSAVILITRDENKSLNSVAAMFIEQLYAILIENKLKNKFNLVLDNFDTIEKCNDLVDILSSGVARGIRTFIATRSLAELVNIYGNYMPRLCDRVVIGDTMLKIVINNTEEVIDKDFEEVIIPWGNVEYPRLGEVSIDIFEVEDFVKAGKTKESSNIHFDDTRDNDTDVSVEKIIKSIDDTIAKLNAMDEYENDAEKSELEQFKIK